ncbi:MAG: LemA protein [Flavobacteriales bacterium]|jgi:LemA protein
MKSILKTIAFATVTLLMTSCGYNSMVEKDESITEQWAQVETQYQRRADLIPNLVSTVEGYADFEKETLMGVIEARSKATSVQIDPSNLTEENLATFQKAQGQISSSLSKLLVTVERYPDLKANENFRDLQAQLEGTENRIAVARRNFNESVKSYNTYIRKFPRNMYAGMFDFEKRAYFAAEEGNEKAPEVSFK